MRTPSLLTVLAAFVLCFGALATSHAAAQPRAPQLSLDAGDRAQELRAEREAIPLDAPAALTLTSAVLAPAGVISGIAVLLLDYHLCVSSCDTTRTRRLDPQVQSILGGTLMAIGAAALVTTVIGAVWWAHNDHARRRLTREIDRLELSPDLRVGTDEAWIGVSGRF